MSEPDQEESPDTDLAPHPVDANPDEAHAPGTSTADGDGDQAAASDDPVLPRSADESDVGWGGRAEDDDERFRREVPPHW